MPARTRARARPSTSAVSGSKNTIRKTYNLVLSASSARKKQHWEELCQNYLDDLRNGVTCETFPYWILKNLKGEAIEQLINTVYGKSARMIETYAPTLCKRFGVPQWQFVLFLGRLPQNKVRDLNKVTKGRPDITFDTLYRELCRIRSQRGVLPDGPFDFKAAEIRSCFQDNDSEDEGEGSFEDHYQSSDESSDDVVLVTGSSENEDHRNSSYNNEDSFDDISKSPVNYNLPRQSSSSVLSDVLSRHVASSVNATSSTSVANSMPHASNARRSATDDTVTRIAEQLDLDSVRQRQAVESEVPGASRLLDSEPLADSLVLDRPEVDTQGQSTCTNETADQRLIELRNNVKFLDNAIHSLRKMHEELKQNQLAIEREESEVLDHINAENQAIQELTKSKMTPEQGEITKAKVSRLVTLGKKHDIIESNRREYQAKRLKCDADIKDFSTSIKRLMTSREFASG